MTATSTIAALRFGTGLSPRHAPPADAAALLSDLDGPDEMARRFPVLSGAEAARLAADYIAAARPALEANDPELNRDRRAELNRAVILAYGRGLWATLSRGAAAPVGFRERLAAFWANHFSVSARQFFLRAGLGAYVDEAIRPHLAGRFTDLLRAAVTHPMMLHYLDQVASVGPNSPAGRRRDRGLNENLAREVLELHTLGVSAGYGQADVRALAELFTGLSVEPGGGFVFRRLLAEPGAKTVLGQGYGGRVHNLADIHAALDDLARHPDTARHVCGKLARHFTADAPDADLVAAMVAAWQRTGGALRPVYAAMLDHPAAWQSFGAKARPPMAFLVAALRALGVESPAAPGPEAARMLRSLIVDPLARMGQPWMDAPGPDGWPDGAEDWITAQGLAARIDWAMTAPARLLPALPDPRAFTVTALADAADDTLRRSVARAESRAEGVGLVLASPAFNRC
jgi:uncharacterized protein (DUF1800 family)